MPVFFAKGINFVFRNFDNCWMMYSKVTACATADLALFDWIIACLLSKSAQVTLVPFLWRVMGRDFPVTSLKLTNISRKVIPQSPCLGLGSFGHFKVLNHMYTSYAASIPQEQHWATKGVISGKAIWSGDWICHDSPWGRCVTEETSSQKGCSSGWGGSQHRCGFGGPPVTLSLIDGLKSWTFLVLGKWTICTYPQISQRCIYLTYISWVHVQNNFPTTAYFCCRLATIQWIFDDICFSFTWHMFFSSIIGIGGFQITLALH